MIPPKNSGPYIGILFCCIAVTITHCDSAGAQTILKAAPENLHDNRETATRVDWYKEPPRDFGSSGRVLEIPHGLLMPVARSLRREAIPLLKDGDAVSLTREQAKHFGFGSEPDDVLRLFIQRRREDLRRYETSIVEDARYLSARSLKTNREIDR